MVDRAHRERFGDAAWETLGLTVALVCRDAISSVDSDREWLNLGTMLQRAGVRAAELGDENDLAIEVLADFADGDRCRTIVERARALVHQRSETELTAMTEQAAATVDRECPDQSFRFRATLILVSMLADSSPDSPDVSSLADKSHKV